MKYILAMLAVLCFLPSQESDAQGFIGVNAGAVYGRTVDIQGFIFPKNEDWICVTAGGGYTAPGPFFFDKKDECLRGFFNHGWHLRLGLRNNITTDHHENHFWWGLQGIYSHTREHAYQTFCDTIPDNDIEAENRFGVFGAALSGGWTWNPFRGKTVWDRLFIDFGLQFSTQVFTKDLFLSDRHYLSGMGFSPLPFRSIHVEPVLIARLELWHGRYGYLKAREIRH